MIDLVLVEGPDASGKSTLAKKIACKLGMTYIHMSGAKCFHPCMWDYHLTVLNQIEWNIKNNHGKFVLDRTWVSEAIYVPIFRPEMGGKFDFQLFRDRLDQLRHVYVLCMDDGVSKRHEENLDPDHPYDLKSFSRVVRGYKELINDCSDDERVLNYDLTVPGRDDEIIDIINRM